MPYGKTSKCGSVFVLVEETEMFWVITFVVAFVIGIIIAAISAKLDSSLIVPWIRTVERGIRSYGEPDKTYVYRKDEWIYLAERTQFRVIKYNDQFFTQIKTFGTGWRDFVYKDNRSKWFSQLSAAEHAIEAATSDVRLYIDVSEYEDPTKYRKVVVATRDVVVKEMR